MAEIIEGIVTCVGPTYTPLLAYTLNLWLDTLDTVYVVTVPEDPCLGVLEQYAGEPHLQVYITDHFYAYGASFNKGAALASAFSVFQPREWVLHFDADVLPPRDWRNIVAPKLKKEYLHGVCRRGSDGSHTDSHGFIPIGFFQIWHRDDPRTWSRPYFNVEWSHAGNYDAQFLYRWPEYLWIDLGFHVTHHGPPRQNWFGPKDPQSGALMGQLLQGGLSKAALEHHSPVYKIPPFQFFLCLEPGDPEWIRQTLQHYAWADPFLVSVRVGVPRQGEIYVRSGTVPPKLRQ